MPPCQCSRRLTRFAPIRLARNAPVALKDQWSWMGVDGAGSSLSFAVSSGRIELGTT